MSDHSLENDDLENVPLVRMEDVQPRERICDYEDEALKTCVVDDVSYEECVLKDDDGSNLGSMVSIRSEEIYQEDSDSAELIVPEMHDHQGYTANLEEPKKETKTLPDSWPTLEILPGGVIKPMGKCDEDEIQPAPAKSKHKLGEMTYACAKCSESFKYLFCLVKHVRCHEDEKLRDRKVALAKLVPAKKTKDLCIPNKRKTKTSTRVKKNPKKS